MNKWKIPVGGVVFVMTDLFFHISHNDKIITRIYCRLLGTVLLTGLKWLRNNLSTRCYDFTSTGQRGKWYDYFFYIFTFDFHILPEYRRIGGRIFPSSYFNNKNSDHPASMRSVLTHLLRIETLSKLLNCRRKSRNYVHGNTYYCKPELISWQ